MTIPLAQRQIALAAITLLAVVVGVALARVLQPDDGDAPAAAAPAGEWYRALAAPYAFPEGARRTACGHPTGRRTLGVAHPVLPCGAKITILFEGREVLTQVVDRGTGVPGREFDVTAALAEEMGLAGVQPIQWRFAAAPG
ncbi:MAG: septal ring lytic transglycosylase RlpA family protein [Gaiellaceae bacterium]